MLWWKHRNHKRIPRGYRATNGLHWAHHHDFWRVTCPQDMVFDVFLDDVAQAPQVRYVVPDLIKSVAPMGLAIDDPKYPAQWYLEELGAELLWENSFGEPSVKVAVIDSGIDIAHPDLRSKITAPKDTWDDDDDPSPNAGEFCFGGMSGICDEHGTAVAGIILADANDLNIIGLCPDCSLIPIKMLGKVTSYQPARVCLVTSLHLNMRSKMTLQ